MGPVHRRLDQGYGDLNYGLDIHPYWLDANAIIDHVTYKVTKIQMRRTFQPSLPPVPAAFLL